LSRLHQTLLLCALSASISFLSCAGSVRIPTADIQAGRVTAIYRVQIDDGESGSRKFRLLLFASLPDRLHAEALSAVGTTELIVDGGGDRISIAVVREKIAYVGDAGPESMKKLLGLELSLEELVRILLTGEREGVAVDMERIPERGGGLPRLLEISAEGRSAHFRLKRLRPLPARPELLGTGTPPARMKTLPLDELDRLELPGS
jgi:hypothetical protein